MNDDTRRAILAHAAEGGPARPPDVDRAVRRGMRRLRLRLLGSYLVVVAGTAAVLVAGSAVATSARQGGAESPAAVRSLRVVPEVLVLDRGDARQLNVRAVATDGSVTDLEDGVTWRSSDAEVVEVDGSSGRVTGTGAGTATITAAHGGRSASATLTVVDPQVTPISVEVTPGSVVLEPAGAEQLTATVTFSDGTTTSAPDGVVWRSSDTAVVELDGDVPGHARARGPGVATVTATVHGRSASASVTVLESATTLTRLEVAPDAVVLAPGDRRLLTARATFSDGAAADVGADATWRSSDPAVAGVDGAGRVLAGDPGTAVLTATYQGRTATAEVTVRGEAPELVSLAVTPAGATVIRDERLQLTATATYDDGTTIDVRDGVEWRTDDPKIAEVGPTGLATAHSPGTARVTATYVGLTADAAITVDPPVTLTSLTVAPPAVTLTPDETRQLTATATYSDGSTTDVRDGVEWRSDDPKVADVDPSGLATAHGPGTATVTATFEGIAGDAVITVDPPVTLTAVTVTPADATLASGDTLQLTATATFSDGTTAEVRDGVEWRTDDADVVQVEAAGLAHANGPGGATVTATYQGKSGDAAIRVVALG